MFWLVPSRSPRRYPAFVSIFEGNWRACASECAPLPSPVASHGRTAAALVPGHCQVGCLRCPLAVLGLHRSRWRCRRSFAICILLGRCRIYMIHCTVTGSGEECLRCYPTERSQMRKGGSWRQGAYYSSINSDIIVEGVFKRNTRRS